MSAPSLPALSARVRSGCFDRAAYDLEPISSSPSRPEGFEHLLRTDEGDAAAGDDAFFHGRTGRVEGVFDAGFLFLHLGFGRGADIDDGHAAGELRQAFLELLAVVVAGRFFDLAADLRHAALDVRVLARAFDDRGVFLVDHDALGAAEVFERDVLELDAEVFGDATCHR